MDPSTVTTGPAPDHDDRGGSALPGLVLAAVVTAAVLTVHAALARTGLPATSPVFLAIVAGLLVGPLVRRGPAAGAPFTRGLRIVSRRLLLVAIVLLGLRFSVGDAVATGGAALGTITAVVVTGIVVAWAAGRWLSVDARLSLLIGVGTAICGNSAIAATAPIVRAREEEVAFASGVITGFGVVAMLALPALGRLLGFGAEAFGVAAGAGVHDAAQAIAAGFAFGPAAGGVATIVKLSRTLFLVPLVLALAVVHRDRDLAGVGPVARLRRAVPWFAVGFLLAAVVRSVGDGLAGAAPWWAGTVDGADTLAGWLLVAAMAAMGLQTQLRALRRVGVRPLVAGLSAAVACAAVALVGASWSG